MKVINPKSNDKYFIVKLSGHVPRRIGIPARFARKENGKTRRCCILKSVYHEEEPCILNIVEDGGKCFLSQGWKGFIKLNNLNDQGRSTLIFFLTSSRPTTFQVIIIPRRSPKITPSTNKANLSELPGGGPTSDRSSERKFRSCLPHHTKETVKQLEMEEEEEDREEDGEAVALKEEGDPCFTYTLRHYDNSFVILPMAFARKTGLEIDKRSVTAKDEEGESWPLEVGVTKSGRPARVRICLKGWAPCRKAHNLVAGDLCRFKYKSAENLLYFKKINK